MAPMHEAINEVDLAFVVDTTSSMTSLINTAQQHMVKMLEDLVKAADIHLQLGIVEYRDHPPQDKMTYRVYPFTANLDAAQKTIKTLKVEGGGDAPEAVLDGIVAACHELSWRQHSRRLMVLIGDAPPHGVGTAGDAFPQGCPCGETVLSVTKHAEEARVTVHAIGLTDYVADSFGEISKYTGGKFFSAQQANAAIEHIATLLKKEFADLEMDRQVLALYQAEPEMEVEEMAARLDVNRYTVSGSLLRLLSRDLIRVTV